MQQFKSFLRMETGEVKCEMGDASRRPPPKISLKHEWKRESNQPIPNPDHDRKGQPIGRTDRTEQPVVGTYIRTVQDGRKTSRSQEINTRSFHEEAAKNDRTGQPVVETGRTHTRSSDESKSLNVEDKTAHDRTGQPVVEGHTNNVPAGSQSRSFHESTSFNVGDETIRDRTEQPVVNRDESVHEQTMLNEVNMDFRTLGLPHSVVNQADSSRVRELVEKIENHPD